VATLTFDLVWDRLTISKDAFALCIGKNYTERMLVDIGTMAFNATRARQRLDLAYVRRFRSEADLAPTVHQKDIADALLFGNVFYNALNFGQVLGQHRMLQTAYDDIAQIGGRRIEIGKKEVALADVLEVRERAEDDEQR
jgi:hypothetical protein